MDMSLSKLGSWWWTGKPGTHSPWGHKELDTTEHLNWTEHANFHFQDKSFFNHFPKNHLINNFDSPLTFWDIQSESFLPPSSSTLSHFLSSPLMLSLMFWESAVTVPPQGWALTIPSICFSFPRFKSISLSLHSLFLREVHPKHLTENCSPTCSHFWLSVSHFIAL